MARPKTGAAIDLDAAYRARGYRGKVATGWPTVSSGGGGIV
jgi:L-rhamnose isomerase